MSSHPAIKDLFGIRIDKFLSSLSDEAKRKMWPIVNALRLELELSGSATFPVPLDKFDRNRCSREDVRAILTNLHGQGILSVSVRYKTEYNPDKFSVQTIDQNPQIYDYPLATVSLNKDQFAYLNTKLELFVHPERLAAARSAIKVLSTRSTTGHYAEIEVIVKQATRDCLVIKDWPSHRSLRDFWLNTRRVLDIICNKLTIGLDGKPKKEIPISLDEFYEKVSLRQKKVIHETLDNLVDKGVVSTKRPDLEDEYILRRDGIFENGKANLLIILPDYLKELRHRISDLVDFIETDGRKRFPLNYPPQPEKLQQQMKAIKTYSERLDQEERIANKVAEKLKGSAKRAVGEKKHVSEKSNKFIVKMNGRKWSEVSMYIHGNGDVRIRFQNGETHETNWQELGLTKTQENKIIGTVNWDFLYTCAMSENTFPLQGLRRAELTKIEQRKCKVKQLLMEKFDTHEDPFDYDPVRRVYLTKFKVLPAPVDRDTLYSTSGILNDGDDKFGDITAQMQSDMRR